MTLRSVKFADPFEHQNTKGSTCQTSDDMLLWHKPDGVYLLSRTFIGSHSSDIGRDDRFLRFRILIVRPAPFVTPESGYYTHVIVIYSTKYKKLD